LLIHLLLRVLEGEPRKQVILDSIQQQRSPFLGHPFQAWLNNSDESFGGGHLSTACYVEDLVPAAIYLALKYADQPEKGLIVNTNLGGNNTCRGAVLGALLGAANGVEAFPDRWIRGLVKPPPELELEVR
jgi:ADP-ribosyl-[dinitrogen reductase] hydrolase